MSGLYEQDSVKVSLGDKTLVLKFRDFDTDIDIDQLTSIDYSNLHGEIVTVSALLNKVGILKTGVENELAILEMDEEILIAQKRKDFRKLAQDLNEKLTIAILDDKITLDEDIQKHRKAIILMKKTLGIVNSWYWGIQSKDKKLGVLMKGVTPEEFAKEITEGVINEILIKKVDNLIQ